MRKYLFCALLIALVAVSCNRDKNLVRATVVDTGDLAAGGCGYLLKLEGEDKPVRPNNLPTAYMHDGYKVKVKFDRDGGGEVCSVYPKYEFIEVIQLTIIKTDLD
ncbi:MAG: hypothetical protein K8F30_15235 [Taibaiella sp.]|nr:hypothetical protein [Taibaiella sp.]